MARKKKSKLIETLEPKEVLAETKEAPSAALELVKKDYYSIDFNINGVPSHEIQIPWTEFAELPEVLSKWLKKNKIDNALIIK